MSATPNRLGHLTIGSAFSKPRLYHGVLLLISPGASPTASGSRFGREPAYRGGCIPKCRIAGRHC